MFGKQESMIVESIEEFLARGGKITKLEMSDSAHKRMEKLKRARKKLTSEKHKDVAKKVDEKIERYRRALSRF